MHLERCERYLRGRGSGRAPGRGSGSTAREAKLAIAPHFTRIPMRSASAGWTMARIPTSMKHSSTSWNSTGDEVIGRTSQELNIWADPCDRENIIEALRQSSVFRGEVQFRTKSGRILWGRMSASLFEHEGIACVLSVTQDITETKAASEHLAEAQAALLKSEERYRAAFQTSLDSVNINRLNDGMFVECNKAFLDVTGYKRDEVLGRTSLELSIWADPAIERI